MDLRPNCRFGTLTSEVLRLNQVAHDGRAWKQLREKLLLDVTGEVRAAVLSQSAIEQRTRLSGTRKVHHLVYVADRIRRDAIKGRTKVPKDLVATAAALLERRAASTRTIAERGYLTTARVHWHLLLKRAGLRGGHGSQIARQLRDLAAGPFSIDDVPSLVQRQTLDTLAQARALIRDAGEAYPAAASQMVALSSALDRFLIELESMAGAPRT